MTAVLAIGMMSALFSQQGFMEKLSDLSLREKGLLVFLFVMSVSEGWVRRP